MTSLQTKNKPIFDFHLPSSTIHSNLTSCSKYSRELIFYKKHLCECQSVLEVPNRKLDGDINSEIRYARPVVSRSATVVFIPKLFLKIFYLNLSSYSL